jgi:hypothetical protein
MRRRERNPGDVCNAIADARHFLKNACANIFAVKREYRYWVYIVASSGKVSRSRRCRAMSTIPTFAIPASPKGEIIEPSALALGKRKNRIEPASAGRHYPLEYHGISPKMTETTL